jgi:glycosyltransferase involved in cell wall biosynthesis
LRLSRPDGSAWLVLVGDGPDRESLAARAEAAGITDRVVFAGRTERPELVYPALDFLLMPSRFEGLPLSLMEAMAAELVPIGTRVSGIPEIVNDARLGWLVDSEDVAGLAAAMEEGLDLARDERRQMGTRARQRVQEHFSADRQFTLLTEAIERFG